MPRKRKLIATMRLYDESPIEGAEEMDDESSDLDDVIDIFEEAAHHSLRYGRHRSAKRNDYREGDFPNAPNIMKALEDSYS